MTRGGDGEHIQGSGRGMSKDPAEKRHTVTIRKLKIIYKENWHPILPLL